MHTFTEIQKAKSALVEERAQRIKEHDAWLKVCAARLKEMSERTTLLTEGVDLLRIDRARKVVQIRGDANEVVSDRDGHSKDVRKNAIEDAKRWIAEKPEALKTQYVGVKNYASFGDQRCDCPYNLGPAHGSIVFSIGLTEEARKRDLTADEIEDALYMLHVLPAISKAQKVAA